MKKLSLLIAVAAVIALASGCCKCGKEEAKGKPVTFDMVIVETSAAPGTGVEDAGLTQGLTQFIQKTFPDAKANVQKIDAAVAKGKPEFSGLDMSYMPLYLIKKSDDMMKAFADPLKAGYVQTVGDYLVFAKQTRQGLYVDKPVQQNQLDLFVMSMCPYGVMAENKIIEAKNQKKFPADAKVKVHFIVTDTGNGTFQSLHGPNEVEEDIRQAIIQEKFPAKFWKYLEERNKDMNASWETAAKKAGIDAAVVKSNRKLGLELLQKDAVYSQQFGVNASPTIVWQGQSVMDFGSLAAKVKGFEFFGQPSSAPAPAGGCGA
ncbi:MAG: DsbA family protein [Elusimicrobium sp.]|jgi:protein-disulfide isomerase|nr:DsbA family protein [Elusimicrobium sp.]